MTGPDDRPLSGWRVLVPRGGRWGAQAAEQLRAVGAVPVVVPLIDLVPVSDPAELDAALARLAGGAFDWLAVTSATTVAVLVERSAGRPLREVLGGARVAAVGPVTASALRQAGADVDLVPDASVPGSRSAEGLVAAWPAAGDRATVLVPHSDIAGPELVLGLRAGGWQVQEVVAYRTVLGPEQDQALQRDLAGGAVDAVLLTSGSTARAMLDRLGAPAATTVVCCLGPRTAQAARDLHLPVHVIAPTPSVAELVHALDEHARTHRPAARPL